MAASAAGRPRRGHSLKHPAGRNGHLIIGTPKDVADKIIGLHKIFGNERILVQMGLGSLPHKDMLRAIELMGKEVAPLVRAAIGGKT